MNDKVNPNNTLNTQPNSNLPVNGVVPDKVAGNATNTNISTPTTPSVSVPSEILDTTSNVTSDTEGLANEKKLPEQRVISNNDNKETLKSVVPLEKQVVDGKKIKDNKNIVKGNETSLSDDNYRGPGFFQKLFAFFIICGLLVFIYFLPNIVSFMLRQEYLFKNYEKITDGILRCSLDKKSGQSEHSYEFEFLFTDNKLTRLDYVDSVVGGDLTLLNTSCIKVKNVADDLSGVFISCNLENGVFTQKQVFNYASINHEEAKAVYIENGGLYPEFKNKENMDELEKRMNADGYSCERSK